MECCHVEPLEATDGRYEKTPIAYNIITIQVILNPPDNIQKCIWIVLSFGDDPLQHTLFCRDNWESPL